MSKSHFTVPQATVIALFIQTVGLVIALVPSLAAEKQAIIGIGSTVIAGVFLVVNALHAKVAANVKGGSA